MYCIILILQLQGINGILADEMGLGKTVQSIAFLCHIAETYRKLFITKKNIYFINYL